MPRLIVLYLIGILTIVAGCESAHRSMVDGVLFVPQQKIKVAPSELLMFYTDVHALKILDNQLGEAMGGSVMREKVGSDILKKLFIVSTDESVGDDNIVYRLVFVDAGAVKYRHIGRKPFRELVDKNRQTIPMDSLLIRIYDRLSEPRS